MTKEIDNLRRWVNEFEGISEFNDHLISAITLHRRKKKCNFFTFVINGNQAFISQIYRVIGPLPEKVIFFNSLRFEAKSDFDHKTSKLKPHLIRVSERYLNEKNLICSRVSIEFSISAEDFYQTLM